LKPLRISWLSGEWRIFGLLLAAMPALGSACRTSSRPPPPAPPMVYIAPVERREVALTMEAVGILDGYVNADIRARVHGFLQTQDFKDGAAVKTGQLLFTIEPSEYAAAVTSAKAALERARVARERNRLQLERDQGLFKTGMISQQDLDNATAGLADSDAQILAATAQLQQAQLNLSYTQMHTPIDGVAGIALVRIGNLVGQDGPTLLTTVSDVDPIRVNFALSEVDYVKSPGRFKHLETRDLAWVKHQLSSLDSGGRAEGGDPGIVLALADGSVFAHRGLVVAANRQIDASTGTIQVQALIANPERTLRPGQYARVRILRDDVGHDALVVPDKALISLQGSYSVAVVGPDNRIQLRRVVLGESSQGIQIIERGVGEGDRIVIEGVQKVSDGLLVDPRTAPADARTTSMLIAPPEPSAAARK
jgi:membrane fusion protein (multidrug efflux system)